MSSPRTVGSLPAHHVHQASRSDSSMNTRPPEEVRTSPLARHGAIASHPARASRCRRPDRNRSDIAASARRGSDGRRSARCDRCSTTRPHSFAANRVHDRGHPDRTRLAPISNYPRPAAQPTLPSRNARYAAARHLSAPRERLRRRTGTALTTTITTAGTSTNLDTTTTGTSTDPSTTAAGYEAAGPPPRSAPSSRLRSAWPATARRSPGPGSAISTDVSEG